MDFPPTLGQVHFSAKKVSKSLHNDLKISVNINLKSFLRRCTSFFDSLRTSRFSLLIKYDSYVVSHNLYDVIQVFAIVYKSKKSQKLL